MTDVEQEGRTMTLAAAARALKLSPMTVKRLIACDALRGRSVDYASGRRRWFVLRESVRRFNECTPQKKPEGAE
jgi:hypothetical protein